MADSKQNIGIEQLIDYINGKSTEHMQESIEEWIYSEEKNRKMFNELKMYYEGKGDFKYLKFQTEEALKIVSKKINAKSTIISWKRIAAIILVLFSVSLLTRFATNENEIKTIVLVNSNLKPLKAYLPDSTVVWLKENSRISYNENFIGETRKVEMHGEVYFNVKRNEQKPFEIYLKNAYIKVLGTSFNIRETKDVISLDVNTGRVFFSQIDDRDNSLIVMKGEGSFLSIANGKLIKYQLRNKNYKAWFTGEIEFINQEIGEVCKFLSKYYKRKIELKDPQYSSKKLTTELNNLSIEEVKSIIEFTLDIELKLK